jgi:hypothetical protein
VVFADEPAQTQLLQLVDDVVQLKPHQRSPEAGSELVLIGRCLGEIADPFGSTGDCGQQVD